MIVPFVIVACALVLVLWRERRAYRRHSAARSRFHAEVDELVHRPSAHQQARARRAAAFDRLIEESGGGNPFAPSAEILPFPPSAPAASLPLASGHTPARTARAPVAGADTPRSGVQERLAAAQLGYLGPHRKVSRWVEPPLKDKRAPESWHSDRGRAPTPGLETDGTEDIGRSTGPAT